MSAEVGTEEIMHLDFDAVLPCEYSGHEGDGPAAWIAVAKGCPSCGDKGPGRYLICDEDKQLLVRSLVLKCMTKDGRGCSAMWPTSSFLEFLPLD